MGLEGHTFIFKKKEKKKNTLPNLACEVYSNLKTVLNLSCCYLESKYCFRFSESFILLFYLVGDLEKYTFELKTGSGLNK